MNKLENKDHHQAKAQGSMRSDVIHLALDLRESSGKGLKHTGSRSTGTVHGCGQTGEGSCCVSLKGTSKMILGISFFFKLIYFIFGCVRSSLLRVGFSLVAESRGYYSLRCAGFSLRWFLLLWSTGSRHAGFSSCGTQAQ